MARHPITAATCPGISGPKTSSSTCIEINLMNNPHVTQMIKRFAFATGILFVVALVHSIQLLSHKHGK
ncbi:MAG: hypothetical protein WBF33_06875 [Candidatus Nitrosopolaris sp.]